MAELRKPIFAWLASVAMLCLTGCQERPRPESAGISAKPKLAPAEVATETDPVAGLANETINRATVRGRAPLFPGEFDRHQCAAIDQLVAKGNEAVGPLRRAVESKDSTVRRNAAFAQALLGDASAAERLYATAEDASLPPVIRAEAVDLLASLAARKTEPLRLDFARLTALFEARSQATDAARHVRVAILHAGAVDGGAAACELIMGNLASRDRAIKHAAIEAAASFDLSGPPAEVMQALDDTNPRIVLAAARAVGRWHPSALDARLARLLKSGDANVRIEATKLVAQAKSAGAALLLAEALKDRDLDVQRQAVAALEELGETDALEDALQHPRWRIRQAAVESLGRLKSASSLPAMTQLVGDDSFNVRASLATAAGEIGHPAAAPIVVELLGDSASMVRQAAKGAFTQLSGDALEDYNPANPAWKNEEPIRRAHQWAAEQSTRMPPAAENHGTASGQSTRVPGTQEADILKLIDALALPPGRARELAIAELVRQEESSVGILERELDARPSAVAAAILDEVLPLVDPFYLYVRNLRHRDVAQRRQAAIRFSRMADERRVPQAVWSRVRSALSVETDGMVRRLLTAKLVEAGDPAVVDVLLEGLHNDDPHTRQSAALYLGKLKDARAVPALAKALEDGRQQVQYAAAAALGEIGDKSAVPAIERCLVTRDIAGRLAFGAALARLGAQSGRDELIRLMSASTTATQVEAAEAMAAAPHESFVPILVEKLDVDNARLTAALTSALRRVTGKDFGYRPAAPHQGRQQAVDQWRAWFRATQEIRRPHPPGNSPGP